MGFDAFCKTCGMILTCSKQKFQCRAVNELYNLSRANGLEKRQELLDQYATDLEVFQCEVSEELRQLAEKIIAARPELYYIEEFNIRVGYVLSYEAKKKDGRIVNADCRKVTGPFVAYLPYDFVITFYEPNISYMSDNQKKILMLHELRHVGIGMKGFIVSPHEVEDFRGIIKEFGISWDDFNAEVSDILAGE